MPRQLSAEKHERVEFIADLMAQNRWQTRITAKRLAKKWGVKRHTVEAYATEASRLLRVDPEHRDSLRAQLIGSFTALAHQAATERSRLTGLADPVGAAKILETLARFAGVDVVPEGAPAPQRIEFVFPDAGIIDTDKPANPSEPSANGGDEGSSVG